MKRISRLIIFIFTFLSLTSSTFAQSPREEFQQMVEQLQKTPNDNAVREKIIKLAPTLKPAPELPDAAVTFEGRAQFAFGSAKSEDDYLAAAREYEKAVAAAPWVPGYYADLCTIYQKAGKFADAKRHCGFYLIGLTDPAQRTDVKRRIAGLDFGIEKATEKANGPQALVQQLQSNYGNRRVMSKLHCERLSRDGRRELKCKDSEAQGATWTPGARDGSWSWMPIYSPTNSLDFRSYNMRYQFRLDANNPNRIIFTADNNGEKDDWYCGLAKGAKIKDIEWKICPDGAAAELSFGTTPDGRARIDMIKSCDAARDCYRERRELE